MHNTKRPTFALAALAFLAASPLSFAMDAASLPTVQSAAVGSRTTTATSQVQTKLDEYRETDVWGRIRSGYAIPDLNNALVTRHTQAYANHPATLSRISGRASP